MFCIRRILQKKAILKQIHKKISDDFSLVLIFKFLIMVSYVNLSENLEIKLLNLG